METINSIYQISFSPTKMKFEEVEAWLMIEYNKKREGFYCNWEIIKSFYEDNQLAIASKGNKAIGFITWRFIGGKTVRIEIAEVKPTFRKKGVGKFLVNEFFKFAKEKGAVVCDLQCSPETSEPFWKRLGFVEFTDPLENLRFSYDSDKKLYMVLVESLITAKQLTNKEIIELWNDEPYRTTNSAPTYIWNLEFAEGTRRLLKPIIQPAHYEWRIRWTIDGKVIVDDKIKRFAQEDIDFGTFIIIKELPISSK